MGRAKQLSSQLELFYTGFTEDKKDSAEQQIVELQRIVDYELKEYTIELLIQKYQDGLESGTNEIYIPEYQRKFVWDTKRQSKFIESLLLGLPIPYLFLADSPEGDGRSEVVDGSQRIRTLKYFLDNLLVLEGLEKLTELEGFRFEDLPLSRQRRFKKKSIRLLELTDKADIAVRKDIFERINTTPVRLTDMEVRKGAYEGEFLDFITECANNVKFQILCPIAEKRLERGNRSERVLRFFAYSERYKEFVHRVDKFVTEYTKDKLEGFDSESMALDFENMLDFVDTYFPYGFKKHPNHKSTPTVRFEAIAVGVNLALKENPDLKPAKPVSSWLQSEEFAELTTSDGANSRTKVINRIEYVKNQLLGI